jgi:putative FmdB family regulatory protein
MPIYEYRCKACGHELEKLQKISDDPLVDCPACGQPALSKLISAAGFRLKGGGWYETDFKKDKKRNLAGDTDSKGSDSKTDNKSESKPKSDSKPAPDKAA